MARRRAVTQRVADALCGITAAVWIAVVLGDAPIRPGTAVATLVAAAVVVAVVARSPLACEHGLPRTAVVAVSGHLVLAAPAVLLLAAPGPWRVVAHAVALVAPVLAAAATVRRIGPSWSLWHAALATTVTAHVLHATLGAGPALIVVPALLLLTASVVVGAPDRDTDPDTDPHPDPLDLPLRDRMHEMRNILGGLSGASHLLGGARTGLTPAERDRIRFAFDAEVERLWCLLEPDGRTIVRPRAAHEPVEVVGLVRARCDLWGTHGRLRFEPAEAEVWASCSPEALLLAVSNCLANCERHAPGAPVTVTVRAEAERARVEILDGGPGPAASAGTRRNAGTGTGLRAAARLLGHHGGTVALRPGPTGGALAVVELPVHSSQARLATFASS